MHSYFSTKIIPKQFSSWLLFFSFGCNLFASPNRATVSPPSFRPTTRTFSSVFLAQAWNNWLQHRPTERSPCGTSRPGRACLLSWVSMKCNSCLSGGGGSEWGVPCFVSSNRLSMGIFSCVFAFLLANSPRPSLHLVGGQTNEYVTKKKHVMSPKSFSSRTAEK